MCVWERYPPYSRRRGSRHLRAKSASDQNYTQLPSQMTTLLLHVTEAQFAFDDEDFSLEEQQSVIDSVVGNTYEVEVDDLFSDEDAEDVLIETVTDATGWCVNYLTFHYVSNN